MQVKNAAQKKAKAIRHSVQGLEWGRRKVNLLLEREELRFAILKE
jgi:hypothetical protein